MKAWLNFVLLDLHKYWGRAAFFSIVLVLLTSAITANEVLLQRAITLRGVRNIDARLIESYLRAWAVDNAEGRNLAEIKQALDVMGRHEDWQVMMGLALFQDGELVHSNWSRLDQLDLSTAQSGDKTVSGGHYEVIDLDHDDHWTLVVYRAELKFPHEGFAARATPLRQMLDEESDDIRLATVWRKGGGAMISASVSVWIALVSMYLGLSVVRFRRLRQIDGLKASIAGLDDELERIRNENAEQDYALERVRNESAEQLDLKGQQVEAVKSEAERFRRQATYAKRSLKNVREELKRVEGSLESVEASKEEAVAARAAEKAAEKAWLDAEKKAEQADQRLADSQREAARREARIAQLESDREEMAQRLRRLDATKGKKQFVDAVWPTLAWHPQARREADDWYRYAGTPSDRAKLTKLLAAVSLGGVSGTEACRLDELTKTAKGVFHNSGRDRVKLYVGKGANGEAVVLSVTACDSKHDSNRNYELLRKRLQDLRADQGS